MRIFERLRGRGRNESNVERKLFETIADDLLRRIERGTEITVMPDRKSACCSCCSVEENPGFSG